VSPRNCGLAGSRISRSEPADPPAAGTSSDLAGQLDWQFGKTLPAGSCYSVGLGGHICGGGYGLMSRAFGLTVDWLTGIRVGTIDRGDTAQLTRVTNQSGTPGDRFLYWAHTAVRVKCLDLGTPRRYTVPVLEKLF
jgi:FAD/FMN-containing dehydrogenase